MIDCLCVSCLREDPIEVVSLFLRPVEHLRLLTLVFILHVHFVKHNLYHVIVNVFYEKFVLGPDDVHVLKGDLSLV